MKSIEIFSSYKCNYACSFCFENDIFRKENYTQDYIEKTIIESYQSGYNHIVFSGGEPTLDKNLLNNIRLAKKIGYSNIVLHTNGFKTSDLIFFRDLCTAGLTGMVLSIHGYKDVCNYITKNKNSFHYIHNTLLNFVQIKKEYPYFILDTNSVICQANLHQLHTILSYLRHFPICRPMFSFTVFENTKVLSDIDLYSQFLEKLEKLVVIAQKYNLIDFCIQGIPYCLVPKSYWKYIDANKSIEKSKLYHVSEILETDDYAKGFTKRQQCKKCDFNSNCKGFLQDSLGNSVISAIFSKNGT